MLFFSLLLLFKLTFYFNIIAYTWQDEGEERKGENGGSKGVGAEHSHGQSAFCFTTRSVSHSTQNQSQSFSSTDGGKSDHGRVIFTSIIFSNFVACVVTRVCTCSLSTVGYVTRLLTVLMLPKSLRMLFRRVLAS